MLERKISEGTATEFERKEYEIKKILNTEVKVYKPQDIAAQINMLLSNSVQKIFDFSEGNSAKIKNRSIPAEYTLSQNYPNPFNPITHLEFGIPNLGFVSLKVYDVLGREIKTLVNEIKPAGNFKVEFDGSNFSSGVYFYRIEAGDFVQSKRMVLIK